MAGASFLGVTDVVVVHVGGAKAEESSLIHRGGPLSGNAGFQEVQQAPPGPRVVPRPTKTDTAWAD
jgi:hypothetical protein